MKRNKNLINEAIKRVLNEKYNLKRIHEAIEYDPEHPERMNPDLERRLGTGEHLFGKSKSIPSTELTNYSAKLASKRFKDIITKVKRYHGIDRINPMMMQQMFQIMGQISQIETIHKDALEQLAVDIVSEEFEIPESMLEANLVPPGTKIDLKDEEEDGGDESQEYQLPKTPKSAQRMEELELEVDKRNMINAMLQGAAKKGHYIFHMVADELDAIDPRLMMLYGKLMSLADLQYWLIPDSMQTSSVGGMEKIEWRKPEKSDEEELEDYDLEDEEEVPVVVAKAWIFPLLVHELIKGTLELAASNWATGHLDFEEQKEVIEKSDTDTPQNELWGMRLGPGIWEKFLDCIPQEDYDIKQWLFKELSQLPAIQFHEFMKEIISGSERCKEVIKTLKELHNEDENESLEDILDDSDYTDMGDILDHLGDEDEDDDFIDDEDDEGYLDYSQLSKRELQELIDDALDQGDFEMVSILQKYM
jgi:hypothetical protein